MDMNGEQVRLIAHCELSLQALPEEFRYCFIEKLCVVISTVSESRSQRYIRCILWISKIASDVFIDFVEKFVTS